MPSVFPLLQNERGSTHSLSHRGEVELCRKGRGAMSSRQQKTLARAGEGSCSKGRRLPSGRDQPDLLVSAVLDDEVADYAGDVAVGVELGRAGRAVVVDLLAGGDRRLGLAPL